MPLNLHLIRNFNDLPACWSKALIALSLVTLLSVAVFFDSWHSIVSIWSRSQTFTHGYVIAPISLWLIWSQHGRYSNLSPSVCWWAILAILANGFIWLVADLVNVLVIKQFATVGILVSGFWMILGNRIAKEMLFPLGFLFFMVPVGEELVQPLMEYTASFTVGLLRLTGIPVYREGLHFTLTSGRWSVVEACSGINYLIASITLGFVYAYISFTSYKKRAVFMLLAVAVPILANGLRAYMIVMIGHLSNLQLAVGVDHLIYGAVFFGLVMLVLFYIGSFWKDAVPYPTARPSTTINNSLHKETIAQLLSVLLIISLSFSIWPVSAALLTNKQLADPDRTLSSSVLQQTAWKQTSAPHWGWTPHFQGVNVESLTYFQNGSRIIGIYQASFGNESQGSAELVNSQNILISANQKSRWKTIQTKSIALLQGENQFTADDVVLRSTQRDLIILRWYRIGTQNTSNDYRAKWLQLIKRLSGDTSEELMIIMYTPAPQNDYQQARSSLIAISENWLPDNNLH